MATISENLQILKNSTNAIKQAIIDKGGDVTGDITTWASAINGISGGGSGEEITFTGTVEMGWGQATIYGDLNKLPEDCVGTYYTYIVSYHTTEGFNTLNRMEYTAPNLFVAEDLFFDNLIIGSASSDVAIIAIILMWQDSNGVWKSTLVKPIIEYSDGPVVVGSN